MITAIQEFIVNTFGREAAVIICASLPIIELRGAIPLGAFLGLSWWQSLILAVIGNMIPVPLIILFINRLILCMGKSKVKVFKRFSDFLSRKVDKNHKKIENAGFWGLTIFIGIPLPMTGAWTGALVASVLKMSFWKSMLSAFIGVLIAGVVMTLASYGFVGFLRIFV